MTYKWFIEETEQQLAHLYPKEEGRAIAVRLLQRFCGISSYEHLVEPYGAIAEEHLPALESAVLQLAAARPLQYIIGIQEFLGRDFFVEEGVLIPRPETEELVLWVMEYVKQAGCTEKSKFGESSSGNNSSQGLSIIDACCGSGAIAVSLAASLPQAKVYAFDISEKALEISHKNSEALLSDSSQVEFFKYDLLKTGIEQDILTVDIIVSNPPYITEAEKNLMRKNVLDYEPEKALFVSNDNPLLFYYALEKFASKHLKSGGAIFMEINEQFGPEVAAIFSETGYIDVTIKQDIFGKDRMVCARLSLYLR